jgi:hypothetical protein
MSQKAILVFGSILAYSSQWISKSLELNPFSVIITCLFISLFAQESIVIQWRNRKKNIAFTREFNRKFPKKHYPLVRHSANIFAIGGCLFLALFADFSVNLMSIHAYILTFFILKWTFDPLLGCFSDNSEKVVQPISAYIIIYIYAVTSSMDASIFELTPIPWTQSMSLVMFFLAVLQMRMAYYEKFCFQSNSNIENQLNLVLFSLLVLSFPRLAIAMEFISSGLR